MIEPKYIGIFSALLITSLIYWKFVKKKYARVGKVDRLYIYPIKGCQGIEIDEIEVTKFGLKYRNIKDRMFSFVDAKGQMVNMQICAKVATIFLEMKSDYQLLARCVDQTKDDLPKSIYIEIPIKERLSKCDEVFEAEFKNRKIKGVVCDKKINTFFSQYLAMSVKLIQHLPELKYRPANTQKKEDPSFERRFNITFQNYVDFHLISLESLDLLNEKIAENSGKQFQVSGLNFRPNMTVTDTNGPFDEDKWRFIKINDVKFIQIENCFRCSNTTIEDAFRKEPIHTLRKFRRSKVKEEDRRVGGSPFFGCLLGTLREGTIRVGDKIEATLVEVI